MNANGNKGGEARGRPSDSRPWQWQEKSAWRLIRDVCEPTGQVRSALLVYAALTEIASNEQSSTFTKPQPYIGALAGVSGKTVQRIIPVFETLKIVRVQKNYVNGLRKQDTFTLLAHGEPTLGHGVHTPGLLRIRRVRHTEESLGRNLEESRSQQTLGSVCRGRNSDKKKKEMPDWIRKCYLDDELLVIDWYNRNNVPRGWKQVNAHAPGLQAALRDWLAYQATFGGSLADRIKTELKRAADMRDAGDEIYNRKNGNRLIRILRRDE